MLELKEREFYTKPSIKRREKRAKAKLRHKKNLKTN
jgi:ribosomal protein S21|tara:strand:+ start:282 stop:389 length:108 start_codon:yes stop_codon:yes gene_type:complete